MKDLQGIKLTDEQFEELAENYSDVEKVCALAHFLELKKEEILEIEELDGEASLSFTYRYDGVELRVMTDDEADEEFNKAFNYVIEDYVLQTIPRDYRKYFDRETYKRDLLLKDGRVMLASYDREEHFSTFNDTLYFIYRID